MCASALNSPAKRQECVIVIKKIFYCTTLYDKVDFSIIIQIECPGEQNKQAKTEKLYFYIFFFSKILSEK